MTVFYASNLVDSAVITATNADASYPVSNLQDHRRTKVFRSTANSCTIVIDTLTSEAVDSFVITENPNNGFGFSSPITLEANNTSDFDTVSPAFTTTLTTSDIDQQYGFAYKEFASQEYRFWRISLTGSSFVEVSNFFLGSKTTLETNDINKEFKFVEKDIANITENIYKQRFIDVIGTQKELTGNFRYMNKTEMDTFFELYDGRRSIKPFFFRMDCTILNEINRYSGMYFFDQKPQLSHVAVGLYNIDFKWKEAN